MSISLGGPMGPIYPVWALAAIHQVGMRCLQENRTIGRRAADEDGIVRKTKIMGGSSFGEPERTAQCLDLSMQIWRYITITSF